MESDSLSLELFLSTTGVLQRLKIDCSCSHLEQAIKDYLSTDDIARNGISFTENFLAELKRIIHVFFKRKSGTLKDSLSMELQYIVLRDLAEIPRHLISNVVLTTNPTFIELSLLSSFLPDAFSFTISIHPNFPLKLGSVVGKLPGMTSEKDLGDLSCIKYFDVTWLPAKSSLASVAKQLQEKLDGLEDYFWYFRNLDNSDIVIVEPLQLPDVFSNYRKILVCATESLLLNISIDPKDFRKQAPKMSWLGKSASGAILADNLANYSWYFRYYVAC